MRKKINRLKEIRELKNLQQAQVAADTCLGRSSISLYENAAFPPMEPTVQLAEYYNVSLDYIMGFTDEITPAAGEIGKLFEAIYSTADGETLNASDVVFLLKAIIAYQQTGSPCGDVPISALRGFISSLSNALNFAAQRDPIKMLDAANSAVTYALDISKMPLIFNDKKKTEVQNGAQ